MTRKWKPDLWEAAVSSVVLTVVLLFVWAIGSQSDFFFYGQEGVTLYRTVELFRVTYTKTGFVLAFILLWIALSLSYLICLRMSDEWKRRIFRYRYILVFLLVAAGVFLEISGSSMSRWSGILGTAGVDNGVLFRTANPYRSDEFAVNTIFAIAQEKNPGQKFPYFSDIVRGTRTDMYIVYGQPVKDIGIIFRPFQWGYLLFGVEKGLAFFWCGRIVFLFMASFEFGRMVLKNTKLALAYAILMVMAPVVQWWFAINGLVEMLIFGQLCAMMLNDFMNARTIRKKLIDSFVFFWSGAVFLLVFYPAWQVALGYVFLVVFLWIIMENRKNRTWSLKQDLPIIVGTGMIVACCLISLLIRSWDTIEATMNTVYPGQRISTDKLEIQELFGSLYNIYLALTDSQLLHEWGFIDFFPIGIIVSVLACIKNRKKDRLLIMLLILEALLICIYTLPVPQFIMKITLLSMSTPNRALIAIQFLNLLLLLRGCTLLRLRGKIPGVFLGACVCALCVVFVFVKNKEEIPLSVMMVVGIVFLFVTMFLLIWMAQKSEKVKRWMCTLTLAIGLIAGGLVNPIQKGLPFLEESELLSAIEEVVANDAEGKWIVEGMKYPDTNLPLMAGASTINSTNVYPDLERWRKLDPNGEYEEYYNRYAHILINLQEEGTEFSLVAPDSFQVTLDQEGLRMLEVRYILSPNELESFSDSETMIEKIETIESSGLFVYKVTYL